MLPAQGLVPQLPGKHHGNDMPGPLLARLDPVVERWAPQAGIPLLVLGNKNDLPEALSANELISRLDLRAVQVGWGPPACTLGQRRGRLTHSDRWAGRRAPASCAP